MVGSGHFQQKAAPAVNPSAGWRPPLLLQRKCACGGSSRGAGDCEACADEKRQGLQRYSPDRDSPAALARRIGPAEEAPPQDSHTAPGTVVGHDFGRMQVHARPIIQRAALDHAMSSTLTGAGADSSAGTMPDRGPSAGLIVEDRAPTSAPGQMHKTEFLNQLETAVCAAADQELVRVGRTAQGCPYIERWIGYYRAKSGQHIERALFKYAPEAAGTSSARDYIPIVAERIRRAVTVWATTGRITGVPEELAGQMGGLPGGAAGAVLSGIGGAITGAIGSIGKAIGGIFAKANDDHPGPEADPERVRAQLGSGHALDGGVKGRMESALGHDFSSVRVHTDARAAQLSRQLNARAFTVGSDVAFAAGEYRPRTLIGDALLAHELAHVVQQRDATATAQPQTRTSESSRLEDDADRSAVAGVLALWGATTTSLSNVAKTTRLRAGSGLALQRCALFRDYKVDPGVETPLGPAHLSDVEKAREGLGKKPEDACATFGMEGHTTGKLKGLCCPKNVVDENECCPPSRIDPLRSRCIKGAEALPLAPR